MHVLDRFRLDGRRLFISGGSRGLGREMALALADVGADVVMTGRDRASLEDAAAAVRSRGQQAFPIVADMSDPSACERACQDALATGPIHILINNVGDRRVSIPIEETPLATWDEMMHLNLTSCFLCTKAIGGAMIRRGAGGRIINISSMSAFIANRGIGGRHYETAKAAMLHFTRCAAADWAPHGITVNAICPGLFMTEPNREWARTRPDVIKTITDATPLARCGEPEELGPLAVYLASDASAFVTGASFVIDGGYTLW
jgi:NAD(P)-dependent dehydrogenase (short-subunit alcohol dehydrogenase family)